MKGFAGGTTMVRHASPRQPWPCCEGDPLLTLPIVLVLLALRPAIQRATKGPVLCLCGEASHVQPTLKGSGEPTWRSAGRSTAE